MFKGKVEPEDAFRLARNNARQGVQFLGGTRAGLVVLNPLMRRRRESFTSPLGLCSGDLEFDDGTEQGNRDGRDKPGDARSESRRSNLA